MYIFCELGCKVVEESSRNKYLNIYNKVYIIELKYHGMLVSDLCHLTVIWGSCLV